MKHISQIKIIAAVIFFALFGVSAARAAEIRLDAHKSEINLGEQFLVDIIIHSEESLNAVEGRLVFPADKFLVKEIRDGNSVINFWVEKPHIEASGVILFSGITPGGFNGPNNMVFSVVFEAKNTAIAYLALKDTKALLNDGLGSQTALSTRDATISIKHGDGNARKEKLTDTEMPENFNPTIESESNIFDGKYFLVFATQDKISGIDRYEAREGEWGWFRVAESPYLLKHQSLDRKIFIKAIDKVGNERIVVLPPQNPLPWYKKHIIFAILIIVGFVIVGLSLRKLLWQKFIKSL